MRHLRTHLPTLIIAALVIAASVAAMWPSPTEVDVATVARGPMRVTIDEEGETRVRDRFIVAAPVAGRLERIELEPGDAVVRGKTVLARITAAEAPLLDARTRTEYLATVEVMRAAVGQALAVRDRAAVERADTAQRLTRQQALSAAGLIPRDVLESAQTLARVATDAHRAAQFAAARTESELQLAAARLEDRSQHGRTVVMIAPVNGVILKRLRESEAVVPAGEPLLEIADPASIEIVSDLLSTEAVQLRAGGTVLIEQWGGDQPLIAKVRRIEPSGFMKVSALGVEEQRVNVVMDFADPKAGRVLGDGYRVEIRAVVWQSETALKVPIGSLFRQGEAWATFVLEGGHVRTQVVQLGRRNDREAEILSGLSEGQQVVLYPPDTLTDSMRAIVRAASGETLER